MTFRDKHSDPFEALMDAMALFGFEDADIVKKGFADSFEAETAREAAVQQFQEAFGRGYESGTSPDPDDVWVVIEELFDAGIPARFGLDHSVHAHKVAMRLRLATEVYGYEVDVTLPAQPEAKYPTLSTKHPEAFVVTISETETGEVVGERAIRPYPCGTEHVAVTQHDGVAASLNHAILFDLGLEIVAPDPSLTEHSRYRVFNREVLDRLESQYGENLPIFHENQPLINRGFPSSLESYKPENATNHEAKFGIPEPENTFKLEDTLPDELSE